MRLGRTILSAIAAGFVALAAPAAVQPAAAQGTIKIGEVNSYKAQPAFLEPYKKGMELAVEEINAAAPETPCFILHLYAGALLNRAALRVLGFTRAEVSFVLLGELVVVTLLAIPIGSGFGFGLAWAVSEAFSNDIYQVSAYPDPSSIGTAAVAVLASAVFSGWMVKRQIDKADLVLALKTRE